MHAQDTPNATAQLPEPAAEKQEVMPLYEPVIPGKRKRLFRKKPLLFGVACLLGLALILAAINLGMLRNYDWNHPPVLEVAQAEPLRVAIVPGAAVYANGQLSQILRERLLTALALYRAGKAKKILVSANNQLVHNRESEIMRLWLIRNGVDQYDVQCDHAGFRTLDTCARAARVWNLGNEKVYFITQRYHLPRTLYLAHAWGLQAVGVSANGDGWNTRSYDHIREALARIKAWLDINILHTQPLHFGPPERI